MIETRIPPPVYALATGASIWLLDRALPALRVIPSPWNRSGWILIALGISLDVYALVLFLGSRTTVNPMRPENAVHLVIRGPNSISRNPMYLGLVLSLCGWAILLGNPSGCLLAWMFARVIVTVQIVPEEAALLDRFGAEYQRYCRRVNRWIGRSSCS